MSTPAATSTFNAAKLPFISVGEPPSVQIPVSQPDSQYELKTESGIPVESVPGVEGGERQETEPGTYVPPALSTSASSIKIKESYNFQFDPVIPPLPYIPQHTQQLISPASESTTCLNNRQTYHLAPPTPPELGVGVGESGASNFVGINGNGRVATGYHDHPTGPMLEPGGYRQDVNAIRGVKDVNRKDEGFWEWVAWIGEVVEGANERIFRWTGGR